MRFFNRDISWLGFNYRVLLEARKKTLPLYERIQFLSIYSSNLDEFFRVRYPVYTSLKKVKGETQDTAQEIQRLIKEQLPIFGSTLHNDILPKLNEEGIHLYYGEDLAKEHNSFVVDYFYHKVLSFLQPIVLGDGKRLESLENNALYFLVSLKGEKQGKLGLVNIPTSHLSRFVSLPSVNGKHYIAFLDDVIRHNLSKLFPTYSVNSCHAIKLTRSADVDLEDEWSDMFEEQVLSMIAKREKGAPTRLLYEKGMPVADIKLIKDYFGLKKSSMIEGGRYHNLKDLSKLPNPKGSSLRFESQPPYDNKRFSKYDSVFDVLDNADEMLHLPYHSYNHVLRFFNEAAIDPRVEEVSVTLYRVAANSFITNALISAAKNGKKVTAFVELKARFDEENNLNWAKKMKQAGVCIVYSIPGMKVHVKVALVKRKIGLQAKYYSLLSTGNFNEGTARFYTDHILFTCNKKITTDANLLFAYLQARKSPANYPELRFNRLLVAGFNFVDKLYELVDKAKASVSKGKRAKIIIKLNNLEEQNIINKLYEASKAGVVVQLIVRGICCLIPGVEGMSENISVRRIVGRYLEHSRVFVFEYDDEIEVYAGSADLMNRNIYRRIEVVFPVYEERLKKELIDILLFQLKDNTQATELLPSGESQEVVKESEVLDAQKATYTYVGSIV